jgi:alpha-D-ribose 1-methylphosphonate 5-triphosphate diphosphatase
MKNILIQNGIIVTPQEAYAGTLFIQNGNIAGISREPHAGIEQFIDATEASIVDVNGCYVLPGLIDLHGDALEKAIQPRKKVLFPISVALHSLQAQLLAAGITTMFHALSFTGEPGLRSNESGYEIAEEIIRLRESGDALLSHQIHVRYELVNSQGYESISRMFDNNWVDLFSVMDHTPQYGKYRTLDDYRYYVEKTHHLTGDACERFIEESRAKRDSIDGSVEKKLVSYALEKGIAIASHDDDTPNKVEEMRSKGITISEFPLNPETAAYAMQAGMFAIVGGPNALRGYSHENHLSARQALKEGLANIICSDYYPFSMLSAVFAMVDDGVDISQSVAYASLHPARAIGWENKLGSLETGKQADLLVVRRPSVGKLPQVARAMIKGQWRLFQG